MTELEFELEFKKRKLQKRKQRRMELLIIGAHLGVVLVLLYWMFGIGMVHGRSMRPAYRDGDLFLYQRRLFREPDYGDVVVIHRQDLERDIVKRIAGKPGDVIDLDDLAPTEKTTGTEPLLKGIFAGLLEKGCKVEGFDAYVTTNVIRAAGVSSSASFEMLVCSIINYVTHHLCCDAWFC